MRGLEELTDLLYAGDAADFVARRDEFAREAREAGDKVTATALRKLRRPTVTAALVNRLVREREDLVTRLFALAERFRDPGLTRARMQDLSVRRRDLLRELVKAADEIGGGLTADKERELEATFGAAIADPEAAEQVRAGRLATALEYSGFGPVLTLVPPPEPGSADSPDAATSGAPPGEADDEESEAERRRRAAEARAAVRSAERLLADRVRARDQATRRHDKLAARADDLRTELALAQSRLAVVEGELDTATSALQEKAAQVDEAQAALDAARDRLP